MRLHGLRQAEIRGDGRSYREKLLIVFAIADERKAPPNAIGKDARRRKPPAASSRKRA